MAGTTETIDQAGGSAATQGDLWGERSRLGRCVGGLERVGYPALPAHPRTRHSRERHKRCSTWVVGRGDFAASQPTGALTSRASMRRRRLFRSLGTASRRGIPCRTSSISLAGQLVRRRHRLQLIHLCCQYHRCAARGEAGSPPGANVAITVFGRPERCESTNVFGSVGQLLPAQAGAGEVVPRCTKWEPLKRWRAKQA